MKKIFFALMAALAVVACNKNVTPDIPVDSADGTRGELRVTINFPEPELQTKVSSPSIVAESTISSIQVFVFNTNSEKTLDADRYQAISPAIAANADPYTLRVTTKTGTKEVWVVANSPRITGVTKLADLKSKQSFLSDNARLESSVWKPNLTMVGSVSSVTIAAYDNTEATVKDTDITINRLVSRISLTNVNVDFRQTAYEGSTFKIKSLYLKNVVKGSLIDGTPLALNDASNYVCKFNKANVASLDSDAAIFSLVTDGLSSTPAEQLTVPAGGANTDGASAFNPGYGWYCYPNKTLKANDHTDSATMPICTRLVIMAEISRAASGSFPAIDPFITYYVLTIPIEMEANRIYNINSVSIKSLGKDNDDDDTLTESGKLDANVTVGPWTGPEVPLSYEF